MTLLVDLFGYLAIILTGAMVTAQSIALGGVLFLVFAARPLGWLAGEARTVTRSVARIAGWAALALALSAAAAVALQGAVLAATLDVTPLSLLGAGFVQASAARIAAALLLAALLATGRAPGLLLLVLCAAELAAATLTTHAAARMEGRATVLALTGLHQFGAAIWIGGIPAFLAALARAPGATAQIGARFSRLSAIGVAAIALSGTGMVLAFVVGPDLDPQGVYGTAYGVMVGAKAAMFALLLMLGLGNFLSIRRIAVRPGLSANRLRRFAEVELGIGVAVFFAAASLTSVPPAVDLTQDRVTWAEIAARNAPEWPRLTSPAYDSLFIPALQATLDAEAAATASKPAPAFVPGAGTLAPRNASDIAWSEYNHHWAGLFVAAIGLLALLARAGVRPARHWPLLFLLLGGFLLVRSDPEVWPLGPVGVWESLRDVEVVQHRFFVLLTLVFAVVEWRVRAFGRRGPIALMFPLACAAGGTALLTHTHAIANIKDQLLIELTHTPLALLGIAAGWSRWLELRLDGMEARRAGWVWPVCLVLSGLLLALYREA